MIDLDRIPHHPAVEELTNIIATMTQRPVPEFFRPIVAYNLARMPAMMNARLVTENSGSLPINIFTIALASSGFGKGYSVSLMEDQYMAGFMNRFLAHTMPEIAEVTLFERAIERAAATGNTEQEEFDALSKEYVDCGPYVVSFDSGSAVAAKQIRTKCVLSGCGALNYMVDEIGMHFTREAGEILPLFLELYDQGKVRAKITKNVKDAARQADYQGSVPANMLLFGTPNNLMDGATKEALFMEMLESGYARRSLFGHGIVDIADVTSKTAEEIYNEQVAANGSAAGDRWISHFTNLADSSRKGWEVRVPAEVSKTLIQYKITCEKIAAGMPEHEHIRANELRYRFDKALKLAGVYAFIDEDGVMTEEQLHAAIKLVEESGAALEKILKREPVCARIARYIASCAGEVTHADLAERLPFYKTGAGARAEQMVLARAWGYSNGMLIRTRVHDGIEFFSGDTLRATDVDRIALTYSEDLAHNYEPVEGPFADLPELLSQPNMNWCVHAFDNQHRSSENLLPGFNLLVLDVDGTTPIPIVEDLLEGYEYIIQTTKRHTEDSHRFRLILPMNYMLELDPDEYTEFMENILEWLPFEVDGGAARDCVRKWATFEGAQVSHQTGDLFDVLPFIPNTSKNEMRQQQLQSLSSLSALQRFFVEKTSLGNRNHMLLRFAMLLVDSGWSFNEIEHEVLRLNASISAPLAQEEVNATILVTVAKKLNSAA